MDADINNSDPAPENNPDNDILEKHLINGFGDSDILDQAVFMSSGLAADAAPWERADAHNNLGIDFLEKGDLWKAAAHFVRALEICRNFESDPCNLLFAEHIRGLTHHNLGHVYLEQGNRMREEQEKLAWHKRAAEELRVAIVLGERHPNLTRFEFEAQLLLARIRKNWKILPDTSKLDLGVTKTHVQEYLSTLLKIMDDNLAAKQRSDRATLDQTLRDLDLLYRELPDNADHSMHYAEVKNLTLQVRTLFIKGPEYQGPLLEP